MVKNFLKSVAIVIGMVALQSCDKDSGPDYAKMKPSMMDIVGAKSVGFIDESALSRGEALSSGLYKIDADGNISAVAVYFTEDEDGNQTQHKDEVKMKSADIYKVSTDYLYFKYCRFVDKKEETIYGLPQYILVRKSDGKMWSLDNIKDEVDLGYYPKNGYFYQAYDGTLYYYPVVNWEVSRIYKFNLKTEPASVEQVVANVTLSSVTMDTKGVICSPQNTNYGERWRGIFVWQKSGFQNVIWKDSDFPFIRDYSDVVEGLKYLYHEPYLETPRFVNFRGQFYLICGLHDGGLCLDNKGVSKSDYPFIERGICCKISTGDTPGSAKIDDSETVNIKNDIASDYGYILKTVEVTDDYILVVGYTEDHSSKPWLTVLNPETKSWKWVTELPEEMTHLGSYYYNNRYWATTTIDENSGAWWIDYKTLEIGFVKFNEEIPSYMNKSGFDEGKVIYSGINPADSHEVKIAVDLMTGNAVTDDNAPVYMFSTLVSLN